MSTLAACWMRTQTAQCCNKPEESIHLPCKEHGVTTAYKRSNGFVQHHLLKSPFLHGGQIVTLKGTQSDGRQSSCPVPVYLVVLSLCQYLQMHYCFIKQLHHTGLAFPKSCFFSISSASTYNSAMNHLENDDVLNSRKTAIFTSDSREGNLQVVREVRSAAINSLPFWMPSFFTQFASY